MEFQEEIDTPLLSEEVEIGAGEADVEVGGGTPGVGFNIQLGRMERLKQAIGQGRANVKDLPAEWKEHEIALHSLSTPHTLFFVSLLVFHMVMTADVAALGPVIQHTFAFLMAYGIIIGVFGIWCIIAWGMTLYSGKTLKSSARNSVDRVSSFLGAVIIFVVQLIYWGGFYGYFAGINPHQMLNLFNLITYRVVVNFGTAMLPLLIWFSFASVSSITEAPHDNFEKWSIF